MKERNGMEYDVWRARRQSVKLLSLLLCIVLFSFKKNYPMCHFTSLGHRESDMTCEIGLKYGKVASHCFGFVGEH